MSHATAKKTNFVAKTGGPKPTAKITTTQKGKEWKKTNFGAKTGGSKPNERNTLGQKGKEWRKAKFGAKTGGSKPNERNTLGQKGKEWRKAKFGAKAGGSKPTDKYTVKQRRKEWQKAKYMKKKPLPPKITQKANDNGPPKANDIGPPKEPQQFSANWKKLQEIIKTTQPEEKKQQPVTPKQQNGVLQNKKAGEHPAKNIHKSSVSSGKPAPERPWKKAKAKTVPNSVIPKDSKVGTEAPRVTDKEASSTKHQNAQPAAPKRQWDEGKSNNKPPVKEKKKKPETVEKATPTEADLWFDDVDPDDIEATLGAEAAQIMRKKQGIKATETESVLVKERAFKGITKIVAIDCEMVGVGPDGEDSIPARVSLVNRYGECIYDKYVKPREKVTDYRTAFSGIRPDDIKNGEDLMTVQKEVAEILKGRILVGHAIHNDLKILLLDHPKKKIRDTQKYKPFKEAVKSGRPSLKVLSKKILNVDVQKGEHSSVQDAQATMKLYTSVKAKWEADIKAKARNKGTEEEKNEKKPRIPRKKGTKSVGK